MEQADLVCSPFEHPQEHLPVVKGPKKPDSHLQANTSTGHSIGLGGGLYLGSHHCCASQPMLTQGSLQRAPSNISWELLHNRIPAWAARTGKGRIEQADRERRLVRGKQKRKGIGKATRLRYQPVTIGCLAQPVTRRHCGTATTPTAVSSPPGKTTESLQAALSYNSEPEMPSWASRGWVHCCKGNKNKQSLSQRLVLSCELYLLLVAIWLCSLQEA